MMDRLQAWTERLVKDLLDCFAHEYRLIKDTLTDTLFMMPHELIGLIKDFQQRFEGKCIHSWKRSRPTFFEVFEDVLCLVDEDKVQILRWDGSRITSLPGRAYWPLRVIARTEQGFSVKQLESEWTPFVPR